jgi:quercetin dioxygenase-like cupin family protein
MKPVPPAQKLLMANRQIRVWEMVVEPGASYPFHRHKYPYLSIALEGAKLVLVDAAGNEEPLTIRAGEAVWKARPDEHAVRNVGRTRFRNRLVELTGSGHRSAGKH